MQSCGICHIEGSTDGHLIDGWVCHRRTKNEMFNFAIQTLSRSIIAVRSTGSTVLIPFCLPYLAKAQAELHQFDDAQHSIDEAIAAVETTNERWCEADICRMAGEISLMFPQPDAAKAATVLSSILSDIFPLTT